MQAAAKTQAQVIRLRDLGSKVSITSLIATRHNFGVEIDGEEAKRWIEQLDPRHTHAQSVAVSLAIVAAVVSVVLIGAFAGVVVYAIHEGYQVTADLDEKKGIVHFHFTYKET
jgi:uncharacterized membrane protein YjgN (DUF898 family)